MVAFVDGVEHIVVAQLVAVVRRCESVPQLQQDRLHEHSRRCEEVDQVPVHVSCVVDQQFQSDG